MNFNCIQYSSIACKIVQTKSNSNHYLLFFRFRVHETRLIEVVFIFNGLQKSLPFNPPGNKISICSSSDIKDIDGLQEVSEVSEKFRIR